MPEETTCPLLDKARNEIAELRAVVTELKECITDMLLKAEE